MPELPEVETARRMLQRVAVGRRIVRVWCAQDPIVFEGVTPARFAAALRGRRVLGARRKGKHVWLELDRRPWPLFHFGMSGGFHTPVRRSLSLMSSGGRIEGWPPRFARLTLWLDDGGVVSFADARRLGRIRLRHDPPAELPVSRLGFDAYRELPSPAEFAARLRERRARIKAVLLDQTFAAGVGNWIADEVLYQAGISPHRSADSLTAAEAARLRTTLRRVLQVAIRAGGDGARFPRTWLFHVRWERGVPTPRGERLRRDTIGGRTTAWAPAVQR
ncbi:MAG TPA: DNA-formamidopyrimidine glycosylase family protein [Candidatus Binatia bacterium]|nr:DNA-formamidopyrimidine glycosylase family protein [Candidatus Binatia bacterium]